MTPYAARELAVEDNDLLFENGQFFGRNAAPGIHLAALARKHATDGAHPFNTSAETSTGANYPNGCHIAECELDPETGVVRVVSYTAVDDPVSYTHLTLPTICSV